MSMAMSTSSRVLFRQSRQLATRRYASTTTEKAAETAKNVQSKATEGLSKVTSSAGSGISKAAAGVSSAASKIGGRTGRIIAFVERQVPKAIYYSRVGLELGKLVFQGQKMQPPSISTFQAYFQRAIKSIRNPGALTQQAQGAAENAAANPEGVMSRVRNLSQAQLISGGVLAAELLGFFTVGEMIGRMKLVGYRGETGAHH